MDHCGCPGAEGIFNDRQAERDLRRYRTKGPKRTTRMLLDALTEQGIEGASLLDIGGGVGAIAHEAFPRGAGRATAVDASEPYLRAAREEAERRGHAERIEFLSGDFVALAPEVPQHDVVTLDRSICCYGDMPALVSASVERAGQLYGFVVPRDAWWNRVGIALANTGLRLFGNPFRAFVHAPPAIALRLREQGFERTFLRQTFIWQVEVWRRVSESSRGRRAG